MIQLRDLKKLGKGIYKDLRNRLPWYLSDWKDAYNYRLIPSTTFIFFTNLLPALAFAQDMFDKTDNSYGVNEVLLSSGLAGIVFGLFAAQPLCIVGVTGPITIFNYTVYSYVSDREQCNYFSFMCWIGLWSCLFHVLIAISNLVGYTRMITRYSCDVFGLFINCIYVQKGIQILTRQFKSKDNYASGWYSVVISLLMTIFGSSSVFFGTNTHYFNHTVRNFCADYAAPLCVVFFTGFSHFNRSSIAVTLQKMPISKSFSPTNHSLRDGWFIKFWKDITVGYVFMALPFALLLTLLFYFDHNVSSLMAQDSRFKLKKPGGFHWDFLLLGITTGVTGLIGIPFPNGLIPQAPLHTNSLKQYEKIEGKEMQYRGVVEQRLTNTAQGLLTIGMMSRPLLVVLGLVPQAVFAGLFLLIGILGVDGNQIVNRIRYICTERESRDSSSEFRKLTNIKWLYLFTLISALSAGVEFAICQTKGAIAFPAVLMLFAGASLFFDRIFPEHDLSILDEPTGSEELIEGLKL